MTTRCPYCDIEVSESAIEAEDGCCPECGALLSAGGGYLGDEEGSSRQPSPVAIALGYLPGMPRWAYGLAGCRSSRCARTPS